MKNRKRNRKKSSEDDLKALDVRKCSERYKGLTISEVDAADSQSDGIDEKIVISGWVRTENPEMW
jgi:hypothetical protein